ncbi:MAG: prepilin-type N-terminal cleavage/methylation domain-containing protein [Conexivisphaerales archaeon]
MKKGFTLIEILVVNVQSSVRELMTALESFYADWNSYPVGNYNNLVAELTSSAYKGVSPSINVSSEKTVSGESGGIVYVKQDVLDSLDRVATSISYTSAGTNYALVVEYKLALGKSGKITATPGSLIVSEVR